MRRLPSRFVLGLYGALALAAWAPDSRADDERPKPAFELRDVDGKTCRLSDHRGRWVVLEWIGFDCPTVDEHYQAPARTIPALQQAFGARGVVWLSIHSAGVGQQGHLDAERSKAAMARLGARPTALLLDTTGAVGKAFGAHVTPEVRVISPRGDVVYAGGVESSDETPVRYLDAVLRAALGGQPLPHTTAPARGCRIHYGAATPTTSGPQAPDFTLTDSNGVVRRLGDFRGRWVILEWVNFDCPFVQKHYHSSHRSMQTLQARSAQMGIVWLAICSSAPGKQGHLSSAQVNGRLRSLGAAPAAYLHDPSGAVGRAYGARTTPDMRVISPEGTIEYAGGIDSIRSASPDDVARASNYVALALADLAARRPIAVKTSRPYGCSVKH